MPMMRDQRRDPALAYHRGARRGKRAMAARTGGWRAMQ
jgi:hypothetical protein